MSGRAKSLSSRGTVFTGGPYAVLRESWLVCLLIIIAGLVGVR